MKKLLAVFDGRHFSKGIFEFAGRLNESEPVLLTGAFLPAIDYTDVMLYYFGGMAGPLFYPDVENEVATVEQNLKDFEERCRQKGIEYRVHRHTEGNIVDALKKESRYSDVVLIGSQLFYENLGEETQEEYLHNAIHKAECPVILVPESYKFPQSNIIAFDGSESSVFALKQFAYLFPELARNPTIVVYATNDDKPIPDLDYVQELAGRHFSDISFFKLDTDPDKYFSTWISEKEGAILVAGSFSRSWLSELFKRTFVEDVVKENKIPVFVAHH